VEDRTEAEIIKDEISRLRGEIARRKAERDALHIKSPCAGIFLLPDTGDLQGRYLRRGEQIGYVINFDNVTARVVVTQRDIDKVRRENKSVSVRMAGTLDEVFPGTVKMEVPAASNELPSLALSLEGGGAFALDPSEKNKAKTYEKIFQFEVLLPDAPRKTIGERVYVRFEHSPEPLVFRWYRAARRTLLGKFNV
jgi:putative peptide zinc metalloprotease protein